MANEFLTIENRTRISGFPERGEANYEVRLTGLDRAQVDAIEQIAIEAQNRIREIGKIGAGAAGPA